MILSQLKLETRCAVAFALLRTAFCAYRAWHQSITHDEAFAFQRYLSGPWSDIWSPAFDANNHVLYTLLAKCSVSLLGMSEFSLRLPSVLAGFAMMIGIYRVLQPCRSLFVRWLAYVALGLHPLILDFSIAARGYGLAIALLVWAVDAAQHERRWRSGSWLGFAISANLTIVFPALGLIAATGLLSAARDRVRNVLALLIPAAGIAGAICSYPMRNATREYFYVGTGSVWDSVFNLLNTALRVPGRPAGLLGEVSVITFIAYYGVAAIAVSWAVALVAGWQKAPRSRFVMPVTLAVTLLGLLVAHRYFGVQYPIDRTGLYLWVLGAFSWAVLADMARSPAARVLLMLPALILSIQFATQIQTSEFSVWPFNAGTRAIALRLSEECVQKPAQSVSVSSHFSDEGSLNFYRITYGIECLRPLVRADPQAMEGYDFYVLSPLGTKPDERKEVLYEDAISGSRLVR